STLYEPAGTLSIEKDPSAPLTAKKGCDETTTKPLIHGCTSHMNLMTFVSSSSFDTGAEPLGCAWLNHVSVPLYVCTLCSVSSLFLMSISWPDTTPWIRGEYMQSCWLMAACVAGALYSPLTLSFAMRTNVSASLPLLTTTALYFTSFALQTSTVLRAFGT